MSENLYFDENFSTMPAELVGPLRKFFGKQIKNLPSKKRRSDAQTIYRYINNANGNLASCIEDEGSKDQLTANFQYNCK
ncbi:hypothetical protein [Pedobacter sp. UYP30]|uniref:hypothetical protein n=1 Tax=Pedobacter sp. UYP30 TaxID=1756400 RepID=UPI0033998630